MKSKILYFLFSLLFLIACSKDKSDDQNNDEKTVIGTWRAYQYNASVVNCGNGSNPGSSNTTLDASKLSDVLVISKDGTGKLLVSGETLATFKWTYVFKDSGNQYLTFADYKIVKVKSDDVLLNTLGDHEYFINGFSPSSLAFYFLGYPSITNPCLTDTKSYAFDRLSY